MKLELSAGQRCGSLAQNPDLGDAREDVPVEYDGEPLKIGFNARYLIDVLGVAQGRRRAARAGRRPLARRGRGRPARPAEPSPRSSCRCASEAGGRPGRPNRRRAAPLPRSSSDFRNLAEVRLEPSPRLTVLVGPNGQGKTNLLEAVYLLCTLKPLRATRLAELVRFGGRAGARARATFEGAGGAPARGRRDRARGPRTAFLDGKPLASSDRLDAYLEGLAAVCFSPDDLLLVKGGPDGRRRFLDRAAFNRWPAVLAEAREYLRALRARNAALRRRRSPRWRRASGSRSFAPGPGCCAAAATLVAELAPRLGRGLRRDLRARTRRGPARLPARRGAPAGRDRGGAGRAALRGARGAARARPGAGLHLGRPHMDDLLWRWAAGRPAPTAARGSSGPSSWRCASPRSRTCAPCCGRPPLLLLDDVSSELDPEKNGYLLDYLSAASRRRPSSPRPTAASSSPRPAPETRLLPGARRQRLELDFPAVIPGP